jgi:hypothetical protein
MTTPSDPLALLRSRSYAALLVLAAIIGVPVSAAAYFFLALVSKMQGWIFTDLPMAWASTLNRSPRPGSRHLRHPRRRRRPLLASHRRRSARLRTGRPSRDRERTAVLVRRRW